MTTTPEHAKVDSLKAKNPLAGNLAHLLLDSDDWTLSNRRAEPAIDIQIQRVIADILSIDFDAYQEERVQLLGLSAQNFGLVAKVIGWAAEPTLPTVEDVAARTVAVQPAVVSDLAEPTVDEASIIAAFAQTEDAVPVQEPVAFIPGDENGENEDEVEGYFADEDVHHARPVGSVTPGMEDLSAFDAPAAPVEPESPASAPAADDDDEDDATLSETPAAPYIETGSYNLIAD